MGPHPRLELRSPFFDSSSRAAASGAAWVLFRYTCHTARDTCPRARVSRRLGETARPVGELASHSTLQQTESGLSTATSRRLQSAVPG